MVQPAEHGCEWRRHAPFRSRMRLKVQVFNNDNNLKYIFIASCETAIHSLSNRHMRPTVAGN